jgi:hypothetical protein
MTIASDLSQQRFQTLVNDNAPTRLLSAIRRGGKFPFLRRQGIWLCRSETGSRLSQGAGAKPTGRIYVQDYVMFLHAAGRKIALLREFACALPGRWTRRFLVSNPEDKRRRAGGFVGVSCANVFCLTK